MPLTAAQKQYLRARLAQARRTRAHKWTPFNPDELERALAQQILAEVVRPLFSRYRQILGTSIDAFSVDATPFDDVVRSTTAEFIATNTARWTEILEQWSVGMRGESRAMFLRNASKILGVEISTLLKDERVNAAAARAVSRSAGLIKSIPREAQTRVLRSMRQVLKGEAPVGFSLRKQLVEVQGITERRAQLIARDQTAKLVTKLDEIRQRDVGITEYVWRTSGDERVRPSHEANNGHTFSWGSPPPETGHPGEDINCRCTSEPDLSPILGLSE